VERVLAREIVRTIGFFTLLSSGGGKLDEFLVKVYGGAGDEVLAYVENFVEWAWIGLTLEGHNVKVLTPSSFKVRTYPNVDLVRVFLYGPFVTGFANSEIWEAVDPHKMRDNLLATGDPLPTLGGRDLVRLERDFKAVVWIYLEGKKTSMLLVKVTVDS
jgi:hypothetical protein